MRFDLINSTVTFGSGNKMLCYNCEFLLDLPERKYYFDREGIASILSGPKFTKEVLTELKALTEKAQEENFSKKQFKEEAKKITPKAALLA